MTATMIRNLSIASIHPGPNDRKHFDASALETLAESMAAHGLAQPITVRPAGDGYELIAGERRWRAAQRLGWETIPALVREMDDEAASAVMLAENAARADLDPIEEAMAYRSRMERFGWSQTRVAEVAGVSASRVNARLKLLTLVPEIQKLVASGSMPMAHGEVTSVLEANRQRIAMRVFTRAEGMPLRRYREVVSKLLEEQSQEALFDLEKLLMQQIPEAGEPAFSWGKGAQVDVPTSNDLPQPEVRPEDSTGVALQRYIAQMQQEGFTTEAQALGNLYKALVAGRKVLHMHHAA